MLVKKLPAQKALFYCQGNKKVDINWNCRQTVSEAGGCRGGRVGCPVCYSKADVKSFSV